MIVLGIATVPWRKESFKKTLSSLAKQTVQPHMLGVYFDGFVGELAGAEDVTPNVRWLSTETPGAGPTESFRFAAGLAKKAADMILVVDDDMLLPPNFIEAMVADHKRLQCSIAACGFGPRGGWVPYDKPVKEDTACTEPGTGACLFTKRDIDIAFSDELAPRYLHTWVCEMFFGYAWQKHGVRCVVPKRDWIIGEQPEAKDERALNYGRRNKDLNAYRKALGEAAGVDPMDWTRKVRR